MSVDAVPLPGAGARTAERPRWWLPALADYFLAMVVYWSFLAAPGGWSRLLGDADTGFHIRAGDQIRATASIPHQLLFSFSAPYAEWIDFEWLSQVWFSLLNSWWGLNGVVFFTGFALAAAVMLVVILAVRRGAGGLVAILAGLVAASAMSLHFLARPHVFTLLFLGLGVWLIDRDGERRTWLVWMLVPLAALWANLHPGFMILLAWLALRVGGAALEGWIWSDLAPPRRREVIRYGLLTAACGAASLVNPYGIRLHLHLLATLRSPWYFDLVDEFRAPDFRSEANFSFLVLLFGGLLLVAGLVRSRRVAEALTVVGFGYLGLTAVRNIPVFAVLATPVIAAEASALWTRWAVWRPRHSLAGILEEFNERLRGGLRLPTAWSAVMAGAMVAAGSSVAVTFPADVFPERILECHRDEIAAARLFTTDQWANLAVYQNYPRQRVFLDSQHHAYPVQVLRAALDAMNGRRDWAATLTAYEVGAVLCPSDSALASLLRQPSSGWRVVDEDRLALLAVRATNQPPAPVLACSTSR